LVRCLRPMETLTAQNTKNWGKSQYISTFCLKIIPKNFWRYRIKNKKNLMRKSDAWILSTYCKLYVKDLQTSDFVWKDPWDFWNSKFWARSYIFWPRITKKSATIFFYGDICRSKLSFPHSEWDFVWEVPLELNISKFWVCSFAPGPRITK
jgi:hypothetical protein